MYAILRSRAAKAKVRAFSPHDLLRSCVSDLLDVGVDIAVVQRFVGHANVTTTATGGVGSTALRIFARTLKPAVEE